MRCSRRNEPDDLDLVAVPVFALDVGADGVPRYSAFNRTALKRAGFALDEVLGKTARELYGGRLGDTAYRHHREAAACGAPRTYELDLPIAGELLSIRTTLLPEFDADGRVCRLVGTCVDISGEAASREDAARLRTHAAEMEQFVSLAAHDLRAPMRNMLVLLEMLRDDFEDHGDGKLDLMEMMQQVADTSAVMIREVLEHTGATGLAPKSETFELGPLCSNIGNVLDPRREHAISWPEARLHCDRTALQIVLRNLIENALKHGGRTRLAIDLDLAPAPGAMIRVRVSDDGVGMSNPGRAFLDSGLARADSGFGLMGVRRLVRARGGDITVSERGGAGCTVAVTLPGRLLPCRTRETACDVAADPQRRLGT